MSFYNFKLGGPSTSASGSSTSSSPGRFVHKTYQDFETRKNGVPSPIAPKPAVGEEGRGKFAVPGWKGSGIISTGGETSRFRLNANNDPHAENRDLQEPLPEELIAMSISTTLAAITHTYSPISIASLYSMGSPTFLRLVKLGGQSDWHTHQFTDEIFIVLQGELIIYYRSFGAEKMVRVGSGELLCVPMRMEHCVVSEEGTEVLLMEGKDA
jgi:mannose-6-phosphate isomerase-like protein (cupin superfamily)